ncbi:hypothetical protein N9M66_02085 [Litoreibacter sp.]|nr:hypothetical protein [Litoreibacter sp.]
MPSYLNDVTVSASVQKMAQFEIAPGKPKGRFPLGLLVVFSAFFGFWIGFLIRMVTEWTTYPLGPIFAVGFVIVALALRFLLGRGKANDAVELQAQAHELEVKATKLEAEVARNSGAFDKWEKQ